MSDWNEQSAPNNNLSPGTIRTSKLVGKNGLQNENKLGKNHDEEKNQLPENQNMRKEITDGIMKSTPIEKVTSKLSDEGVFPS